MVLSSALNVRYLSNLDIPNPPHQNLNTGRGQRLDQSQSNNVLLVTLSSPILTSMYIPRLRKYKETAPTRIFANQTTFIVYVKLIGETVL